MYPTIIGVCKFTGAFLAELGTAYFMLTCTTIEDVIGGYVKFLVVAEVETIMAMSLRSVDIAGKMEEKPIMMRSKTKIFDDLELVKKWMKNDWNGHSNPLE